MPKNAQSVVHLRSRWYQYTCCAVSLTLSPPLAVVVVVVVAAAVDSY